MSYSPPSRPIPTEDQFSVWADDRISANEQKITGPVWLCEFAGTRASCLSYLDAALISDEGGFRVWGFAVYPPGTTPAPKLPMTIDELLKEVIGPNWQNTVIPWVRKER